VYDIVVDKKHTGKSSSLASLRDFLYMCRLTGTSVPKNIL